MKKGQAVVAKGIEKVGGSDVASLKIKIEYFSLLCWIPHRFRRHFILDND
jgi:hypothetical protein